MFAADRRAGAAGDRGETGVGGKMRGRSEGFVRDLCEESGCGPDADSRHAGQDRPKRVGMYKAFDFAGDLVTLFAQGGELLGQARHDDSGCLRAGHDHSLLTERLNNFGGKAFAHTRGELGQAVGEHLLAGCGSSTGEG